MTQEPTRVFIKEIYSKTPKKNFATKQPMYFILMTFGI